MTFRECRFFQNHRVALARCRTKALTLKYFRSSITGLSDWLSTLRRVRYLTRRKTRFWPLVKRYQTGFPPAGSRSKVSDSLTCHLPPSPSFLAQTPFLFPLLFSFFLTGARFLWGYRVKFPFNSAFELLVGIASQRLLVTLNRVFEVVINVMS